LQGPDDVASVTGRTLVASLVYGGAAFVPACIESGAVLSRRDDIDFLVLDDCSPDASWGEEIRDRCRDLDVGYYRSPRNIGIPRNMNLALRLAVSGGYDFVVIANSDVIFPPNLVDALAGVVEHHPSVASVTAWSNQASSFSLRNTDPVRNLGAPDLVSRASSLLEEHFGSRALEIPVGVGFCMLIPVSAIPRVGLFDPIFGRGYCEEVDWCLRASSFGMRNMLSPSAFVYHIGSATTTTEGLLRAEHTSVFEHDAIIDLRYPDYRRSLQEYADRGTLQQLQDEGAQAMVLAGAREHGYVVEASVIDYSGDRNTSAAHFVVTPDGRPGSLHGSHAGFEASYVLGGWGVLELLEELVGRPAQRVIIRDRGARAEALVRSAIEQSIPVVDRFDYPRTVAPLGRAELARD
jgi:GT2 family glycosyltransferase